VSESSGWRKGTVDGGVFGGFPLFGMEALISRASSIRFNP